MAPFRCESRIKLRLRTDPSNFTPVVKDVRAKISVIWPDQSSVLDFCLAKKRNILQRLENFSNQDGL